MTFHFLLKPEAVALTSAGSKNDILEMVAQTFAQAWNLDAAIVLEQIEEREKLGSTGFGRGVAIPHARYADINRPLAVLIKLDRPVDFDSADGLPVDLVFGLLSPENCGAAHLHALAEVSRLLRDERMHDAMSDAQSEEALYSLINNVMDRDAA